MQNKLRKVGICGIGHVGAHAAYALMLQGIVDELVLVDVSEGKMLSEHQDLGDALSYMPHHINLTYGTYKDFHDCDIVVMSVGHIEEGENDRLSELHNSKKMIDECLDGIFTSGFDGIFINITNPCDVMTHYIYEKTGYPKYKLIGTGTSLDSARLQRVLARETGIDEKSIQAYVLGEHGESQMIPWTTISFNGKSLQALQKEQPERFTFDEEKILEEVRSAGWRVFKGKTGTEYGIATTLAHIVKIIFHNERAIVPISVLMEGQYGEFDMHMSTPCVLGRNGVEEVLVYDLNEQELMKLHDSGNIMREHYTKIKER